MSDEWRVFLNSPLGAAVGFAAGSLVVYVVVIPLGWWLNRRERRRWQQQEAERQRQWALQRQLSAMERQIREEQLPAAERERLQASRAHEVAIRAEARRRLGLPEEDPHC